MARSLPKTFPAAQHTLRTRIANPAGLFDRFEVMAVVLFWLPTSAYSNGSCAGLLPAGHTV